jgi:hypothetical protein
MAVGGLDDADINNLALEVMVAEPAASVVFGVGGDALTLTGEDLSEERCGELI